MELWLWTLVALLPVVLVQGTLLGGQTKVTEPVDPKLLDFALDAIRQKLHQGGYNDSQIGQFRLTDAEKQIVQGVKFTLTFRSKDFTCQVVVWERLWKTPPMQVTDGPKCFRG